MSVQNVGEAITATKNTIQSIFDYILVASKVLEISAYALSNIDVEIRRHLTIANNMINRRGNILLNVEKEFPSDKENFCISSIDCPLCAHLFSCREAMEEVNGNNDDMLLESIEIVLNNNISNELVESHIIYALSQIVDSERYILNSEPDILI